jgi:hypothetical protein
LMKLFPAILAIAEQHGRDPGAKGEGDRQIIEIGEGNIAEEPPEVVFTRNLVGHADPVLPVSGSDPANEPARQVEEDPERSNPDPHALQEADRRPEVGHEGAGGDDVAEEREHDQRSIVRNRSRPNLDPRRDHERRAD